MGALAILKSWIAGAPVEDPNPAALDIAHRAIELDLLHEGGAVFPYPDGLEVEEWIGLRCLALARREAASETNKDAERDHARAAKKAELIALSRRNR